MLFIVLFTTSGWVYVWKMPKEAYNPKVKHGSWSVMIWAAIFRFSAGPRIALNGQITASDCVDILGDRVNPVVQMLFPNNDAIFQDDSLHIYSQNCSVWFWGAWGCNSSSLASVINRLKYIEPLWSVLESRARSRFPFPSSLKQLEDVLHEDG